MARKPPSADTLKLLYVRSGNECAFPSCTHPIFNDEGLYIAQLCHIKGANEGGQRFDKNQTDEERRVPENLFFMCHRHHKETDVEEKYTVEKLIEIKTSHESRFTEAGREFSNNMIRQILYEASYFWNKQSAKTFELQDLKIERDFDLDIFDLLNELSEHIEIISNYCDLCANSDSSETLHKELNQLFEKAGLDYSKVRNIPYYENPFVNRNWEIHNIGRPNFFSHITLCLHQLKIKMADELLKNNVGNNYLKKKLEKFREEFDEAYDNTYYVG